LDFSHTNIIDTMELFYSKASYYAKMDFTLYIGTVLCMCVYITIQSKKEIQKITDFKISYLIRGNNKNVQYKYSNISKIGFQLCQQYQQNNNQNVVRIRNGKKFHEFIIDRK